MPKIMHGIYIGIIFTLIILLAIFFVITKNKKAELQNQINQQNSKIQELKKTLNSAPASSTIVYKYIKTPVYITTTTNSEGSTISPTILEPIIKTKNQLCELAKNNNIALIVKTQNKYVTCETDFCNPDNSKITFSSQFFTEVATIEAHKSIFQFHILAGYEFYYNQFAIGTTLLNYKSIVLGANLDTDFKNISDT
ncbi:MAG: hypothetical protein ACP5LM_05615, partial [Thermoplasmata archaeon]